MTQLNQEQTFKQFMKQYRKQPNRFGDLANDMAADRSFTKKNTRNGILDYLDSVGACDDAIDIFKELWLEYESEIRIEKYKAFRRVSK